MSSLAERVLRAPHGDEAPLKGQTLQKLEAMLGQNWHVVEGHHLEGKFKLRDFAEALTFTNRIGALAEAVDHHPEICLTWGSVKIILWTHSIGGLSEADFIFAAKVDQMV